MSVPGATRSGLVRWSSQGPRLLNAAMHSLLPDMNSLAIGGAGNLVGQPAPQVVFANGPSTRLLRQAPTVSAFLLEAGEPIDNQSTEPWLEWKGFAAVPALPEIEKVGVVLLTVTFLPADVIVFPQASDAVAVIV